MRTLDEKLNKHLQKWRESQKNSTGIVPLELDEDEAFAILTAHMFDLREKLISRKEPYCSDDVFVIAAISRLRREYVL